MGLVQNADRTSQPIFTKYASPFDWPWSIDTVVAESRRILSYLDNVPEEAMPPKSLWHSPFKCRAWIKEHHPYLKNKKGNGMLEFDDREIERT